MRNKDHSTERGKQKAEGKKQITEKQKGEKKKNLGNHCTYVHVSKYIDDTDRAQKSTCTLTEYCSVLHRHAQFHDLQSSTLNQS